MGEKKEKKEKKWLYNNWGSRRCERITAGRGAMHFVGPVSNKSVQVYLKAQRKG